MSGENSESKDIIDEMLNNHNEAKKLPDSKPDREKYCENCMKMDTETYVKKDARELTVCAICHTTLSKQRYQKAIENDVLKYQEEKCTACEQIEEDTELETKRIFNEKYHVCSNCKRMLSTDEYFEWKNAQ